MRISTVLTTDTSSASAPPGETNDLIALMLGATRLIDAFVEATEARAKAETPDAVTSDDPLVAAALGLVSFRRSLRRWHLHAIHDHQIIARGEAGPEASPADTVWLR
jgi:hypothetical protein